MRHRGVGWLGAFMAMVALGAFLSGLHQGYRHAFPIEFMRGLTGWWLPVSAVAPAPFSDVSGRVRVSCPTDPLVVLALGQSNAANYLATPVARRDDARAYVFWQGDCYLIEDPVLGATGEGGSLWTIFAQRVSSAERRAAVIIAAAVAGSRAAEWAAPLGHARDAAARVREAAVRGLKPVFVIWHQGEADAARSTKAENYERALGATLDTLHATLPDARIFLLQASYCRPHSRGSASIIEAQRRASSVRPFVGIVMNTDTLDDRHRYDRCHFNDNGVERIVSALVTAVASGSPAPVRRSQ